MSAVKRVYLHVGLHKTGTTFLQSVLQANRAQLAEQQVCFPGGEDGVVQAFAVWDLVGRRPRGTRDDRIAGQWDALCAQVSSSDLPTALLSVEYLSLATVTQARRAVASFGDAEVHVVVTARDLGRVVVSAWQEAVKNDQTWTWDDYATALRDPDARARNPARGFWLRHDLAAVLETWRSAVSADRIHVVVVPPVGSGTDQLVARFASVVGVDPDRLGQEVTWTNESIGAAGVEVVRRLNERLGQRLNQRQYHTVVKHQVASALRGSGQAQPMRLPPEHEEWVSAEAERMIDHVSSGGYDVVGDLDGLRPRTDGPGRRPGAASSDELLDAALDALAAMTERHATSWWKGRRPDSRVAGERSRARLASGVRGAAFRAKRRGAELADRNRVAERAMRAFLGVRARIRRSEAAHGD